MKKLLLGLLAAAVVTLTLAGCKNNEDTGTAPIIHDAFFASNTDDTSYSNTKTQYKLTTLSLSKHTDLIVFDVEDPDLDITEITISTKSDFSTYYHWTGLKFNNEVARFWSALTCGWREINPTNYIISNSPIYVKVIDSKGNESEVFTITGITITN